MWNEHVSHFCVPGEVTLIHLTVGGNVERELSPSLESYARCNCHSPACGWNCGVWIVPPLYWIVLPFKALGKGIDILLTLGGTVEQLLI